MRARPTAPSRLAPPYHIRPPRPGECGWTRSENSRCPTPLNAGRLAADQAQQPVHALVAEVLDVGRVGVERGLDLS